MGVSCLEACPECARHVRCGSLVCPFCGAKAQFFLRVADYRLETPLGRGKQFALGAALTAAGFTMSCEAAIEPMYGIACAPHECEVSPGVAGASGHATGGAPIGGSGGVSGADPGGTGNAASGGRGDAGGEGGNEGGAAGNDGAPL